MAAPLHDKSYIGLERVKRYRTVAFIIRVSYHIDSMGELYLSLSARMVNSSRARFPDGRLNTASMGAPPGPENITWVTSGPPASSCPGISVSPIGTAAGAGRSSQRSGAVASGRDSAIDRRPTTTAATAAISRAANCRYSIAVQIRIPEQQPPIGLLLRACAGPNQDLGTAEVNPAYRGYLILLRRRA